MTARNLSPRQFLKANPNQMALPGMEEISPNPAAKVVAQGYTIRHHFYDGTHSLTASHPDSPVEYVTAVKGDVARLDYSGSNKELPSYRSRPLHNDYKVGEIEMVKTANEEQRKGIATALYGVGRKYGRVKPQHSTDRTDKGDQWAYAASKAHGGRVPKLKA